MSSTQQTADRQRPTGTASLVLGAGALAMMGSPALPDFLPVSVRFLPLYFVVPAGICAVLAGVVPLRRARGEERADRRRARAGIVLGSTAIVVPLTLVVMAFVLLSQTYQ